MMYTTLKVISDRFELTFFLRKNETGKISSYICPRYEFEEQKDSTRMIIYARSIDLEPIGLLEMEKSLKLFRRSRNRKFFTLAQISKICRSDSSILMNLSNFNMILKTYRKHLPGVDWSIGDIQPDVRVGDEPKSLKETEMVNKSDLPIKSRLKSTSLSFSKRKRSIIEDERSMRRRIENEVRQEISLKMIQSIVQRTEKWKYKFIQDLSEKYKHDLAGSIKNVEAYYKEKLQRQAETYERQIQNLKGKMRRISSDVRTSLHIEINKYSERLPEPPL